MSRVPRKVLLAAAALLMPLTSVAAQESVGYVCASGYNSSDMIAWVGRQIVRVSAPERPIYYAGYFGELVAADFRTRMRGTYSAADMAVTDRLYMDGGFGQFTIGFTSVEDARRYCMQRIAYYRGEGYEVFGIGQPIFDGREELQVQHLSFLSAAEFPNYVPGTVAARARREGSGSSGSSGSGGAASTGSSGSSGPRWENGVCIGRWWECETAAERAERLRRIAERDIASVRRLVGEADAAYDRRAFRDALDLYRRALNFPSYVALREERAHARERVEYLSQNLATLEYAASSAATGLSFGFGFGQSHLAADPSGAAGGLFAVEVKHNGSLLTTMWSVGTSRVGIGRAFGEEDAFNTAGEFTEHMFGVTAIVPGVRLGNFGLHAGYRFQQTSQRALHLMTTGIIWGVDPGPGFRLDITPVYGKPQYGIAFLLDFSDLFD